MRTFQYLKPTSLAEALGLLNEHGDKAKVIAGGTDLMIQWKKRLLSPDYIISLEKRSGTELHQLRRELANRERYHSQIIGAFSGDSKVVPRNLGCSERSGICSGEELSHHRG